MSERSTRWTRRRALQASGAALAVGVAGCAGGDGGSGDSGPYDGWLDGASGFESVADATGQASVTVDVGAGGGYAFDPAAVRISVGTEVVWEWLGRGGSHNVKHLDDEFESELVAEQGHTFSHTFDSAGVYKYVCVPHRSTGMKGVVEVVDE